MAFDEPAAIESFWQARARGEYFPTAWFDRLALDEAYRIQLGMIARRCAAGERQIGWKVGLTAKAIQEQFKFNEPVFGCILESQPSGTVLPTASLISPGFENELCMRMGRDLSGEVDLAAARAAVDVIYPSLEIIETRGDFVRQIAVALADNAQQRTVILGAPIKMTPDLTLESIEARVLINGEEVAKGLGSAVLGNPLNSIIWLARKLGEYGRGLRAGELIMTGSFTRQFPLHGGDKVRTEFAGIGAVDVRLS